ncbi:ABC transporter permease [Rhizobium oryzicola]|uniref:ABC transporter permease n=1 Tax=Rhizobium oryzicola TaxID=1232668 RepID=A0ABT8SPM4_9HYPH|nr:ABC transporter permease [Rhizobium oryzicola]MDO1580485.1 ABC transporter permease [Rhizobium oryzicola]
MDRLRNIFWLGIKELQALAKETILIIFIIWSFGFSIYSQATGLGENINNAAIAIVDEDHSVLSRNIGSLFYPPYFKRAEEIGPGDIDARMDRGDFTFVLVIPPQFEQDIRTGRTTSIQLNVDATAVQQATVGAGYIQNMVEGEVARYAERFNQPRGLTQGLVLRRAFNPNGKESWFRAIVALGDQLSLLTIVLTGAALLREREHGTLEHLMVMPLTAFEIALSKVWSNGLVIFVSFVLSLTFVVQGILQVPVAGSRILLLGGTSLYLFAAAAIGIFLGTIARTMAQFALLMLLTVLPMMILSGGMTPVESQPDWLQAITWLLPSRHYITIMQAIVYRGAGLDIVGSELLTIAGMGLVFLLASISLFRRSVMTMK